LKTLLRKCFICNTYTLKDKCPRCNADTHNPHPPKFSLDDKYVRYRIAERYNKEENNKNIER
jgi:H/ACA ribonucleoprotein complex subunit 3